MRKVVLVALSVIVVACLVLGGYRFYLIRTSESLLADVKSLKLGESNFADADRIATKYARFRLEGNASVPASLNPEQNFFPGSRCTPDRCFVYLSVEGNRTLCSLASRGAVP
jgi:hypothetical protein